MIQDISLAEDNEIIQDKQHEVYLNKIFTDAKKEIYIFSGWISDKVIEKYSEQLLNAINNSVNIFIIYGYKDSKQNRTVNKYEIEALQLIKSINSKSEGKGSIKQKI